jgi:hypothetical protein
LLITAQNAPKKKNVFQETKEKRKTSKRLSMKNSIVGEGWGRGKWKGVSNMARLSLLVNRVHARFSMSKQT